MKPHAHASPAHLMVASVAGSILRANRAALGALLGEERVREILAKDGRHRFWDEALAVEWVELSRVEDSFCAIAAAAGRDPLTLNEAVTRLGTEQSFRSVWRVLLRLTTDDALIARSNLLYGRAFNTGSLEYERIDAGKALLRVTQWNDPPAFHMRGLAAGIETMLKLAGRLDARVRYEPVGRAAFFRAQSRVPLG